MSESDAKALKQLLVDILAEVLKQQLLIDILLDKSLPIDVRDDAAMDLSYHRNHEVLAVLMDVAKNTEEDYIVLASCGESIGEIILALGLPHDLIEELDGIAKIEAQSRLSYALGPGAREIRADYDENTLVIYQAYSPAIAAPALAAQKFVPPFSFGRMTWIKPSFLWLMERSNWGQKKGQETILAVRVTRAGWEEALSLGVLTEAEPSVYSTYAAWETQFNQAQVHIQWDPERSLRGTSLLYGSIQVGLSRHIIERYVNDWTVSIEDYTPRVRKISALVRTGKETQAKALLPAERLYPLPNDLARRVGMG